MDLRHTLFDPLIINSMVELPTGQLGNPTTFFHDLCREAWTQPMLDSTCSTPALNLTLSETSYQCITTMIHPVSLLNEHGRRRGFECLSTIYKGLSLPRLPMHLRQALIPAPTQEPQPRSYPSSCLLYWETSLFKKAAMSSCSMITLKCY